VEYPLSSAEALVRPWRRATVILAALAAVQLLLLLVAGLFLIGKPQRHAQAAVARKSEAVVRRTAPRHHAARRKPVVSVPRLSREHTSVLVLNGNGQHGAAATEATIVHARGYLIAAVGNAARHDYPRSIVMYRPGYRPEAARLAHDLNVPIVAPIDGLTHAQMKGARLALIKGQN
jgi:hypothetical protein